MPRPKCSIVMATFNRAHLMAPPLICYAHQSFPRDEFELVVVDDHSTDQTQHLVKKWGESYKIKYQLVTPGPKMESWRDCGAVLNCGIRAATGEHIILTHPEVMPGRQSVAACVDVLSKKMGTYACCKPYYLSQRDQTRLPMVPWIPLGPLAVRQIEGFYDEDQDPAVKLSDYAPRAIEATDHWDSWVFGGCSRATWKYLGGMLETGKWGSVDVAFLERRKTLGITNHTCMEELTFCVHQNHDGPGNVPTPRDQDVWMKELEGLKLSDAEAMRYPAVDYLGWG